MLEQALQRLQQIGLDVRTEAVLNEVQELPAELRFSCGRLRAVKTKLRQIQLADECIDPEQGCLRR